MDRQAAPRPRSPNTWLSAIVSVVLGAASIGVAFWMADDYLAEPPPSSKSSTDIVEMTVTPEGATEHLSAAPGMSVLHTLYLDQNVELIVASGENVEAMRVTVNLIPGDVAIGGGWSCFVGVYPRDASQWDSLLKAGEPLYEPVEATIPYGQTLSCGRTGQLYVDLPRGLRDISPTSIRVAAGYVGHVGYAITEALTLPPSWSTPEPNGFTLNRTGAAELSEDGQQTTYFYGTELATPQPDPFVSMARNGYRFTDASAVVSIERRAWIAALPAGAGAGLILSALVPAIRRRRGEAIRPVLTGPLLSSQPSLDRSSGATRHSRLVRRRAGKPNH